MISDVNSEDRLVQETFAEHLHQTAFRSSDGTRLERLSTRASRSSTSATRARTTSWPFAS